MGVTIGPIELLPLYAVAFILEQNREFVFDGFRKPEMHIKNIS